MATDRDLDEMSYSAAPALAGSSSSAAPPWAVEELQRAIKSKLFWEQKIFDEQIVAKYREYASDIGIGSEAFTKALEKLRGQASYTRPDRGTTSSTDNGANAEESRAAVATTTGAKAFEFDEDELTRAVASMQLKIPKMMVEPLEEKHNRVWFADNVVPAELRRTLISCLDAIADRPEKDFHPNSNDQVLDLIHPSLFPYVKNVSFVPDESALPPPSYLSQWTRQYEDSKFQWLPAQFRVGLDGSVNIESYINNLESDSNQELYKTIELIFGVFLPMFERVLQEKNLRGRELQVTVKAANYIIQPGDAAFEGQWHVEGMTHEHIIASGIYYYSTSPCLRDAGLEFRRPRDEYIDYPEIMKYSYQNAETEEEVERMNEMFGDLEENIPLGAVPTSEDRLLVFSNELQHKVSKIVNESSDEVGTRKILVFFLVDPSIEIVSSKHVPEQQWEKRIPALIDIMEDVGKEVAGQTLPQEILKTIVSKAQHGFTTEEAKRYRIELMQDRQMKMEHDNEEWTRQYELCEH